MSQQQAAAAAAAQDDPKLFVQTLWLQIIIHLAQNDRRAHVHHLKQVSCDFEPCSPFYGQFSVQKIASFSLSSGRLSVCETSRPSPVCKAGFSNEGHCSFTMIGPSNTYNMAFNKSSGVQWCHSEIHLEVQMSIFSASFRTSTSLQLVPSSKSSSPSWLPQWTLYPI